MKYVCEKASITLNGISLTVGGIKEPTNSFWIAEIPHTWSNTSLKDILVGDFVNLEADLMAKYAERLLINNQNDQKKSPNNSSQPDLSRSWLESNGWY